jgi:plasmid stabilization system protein ParE
LDRSLAELGEYPEIVPVRYDVSRELRGRLIEQYVIVYRVEKDVIDVKRILHREGRSTRGHEVGAGSLIRRA